MSINFDRLRQDKLRRALRNDVTKYTDEEKKLIERMVEIDFTTSADEEDPEAP